MLKGKYIIKIGDEVIKEVDNVITNDGMTIIRQYLAGVARTWAGAIAVGTMNNNDPAQTDTSLEFEISRVPVLISSVDDEQIVLTATLDSELEANIFELGVYPALTNVISRGFDDRLIATFGEDWTDTSGVSLASSYFSGTEDLPDGRSGYRNLIIDATGIDAQYDTGIDVSGYSQLDSFSILYNCDSTGTNRTVRVTLIDDQLPTAGTKYYDFDLDGSSTGYKIITSLFGNFTVTGDFNNNVSQISITSSAASGCTIHLDAMKFNDTDETNLDFSLVSRAIVGTAGSSTTSDYIVKPSDVEMDIEYRLYMGFPIAGPA